MSRLVYDLPALQGADLGSALQAVVAARVIRARQELDPRLRHEVPCLACGDLYKPVGADALVFTLCPECTIAVADGPAVIRFSTEYSDPRSYPSHLARAETAARPEVIQPAEEPDIPQASWFQEAGSDATR